MNPLAGFPLITVKLNVLNNAVSILKFSFISFKTISSLVKTLCPETNFFHLGKRVWFPSATFDIAVGKQPSVYSACVLVVKHSSLSPKPELSLPVCCPLLELRGGRAGGSPAPFSWMPLDQSFPDQPIPRLPWHGAGGGRVCIQPTSFFPWPVKITFLIFSFFFSYLLLGWSNSLSLAQLENEKQEETSRFPFWTGHH